jgi:hypothetical protein
MKPNYKNDIAPQEGKIWLNAASEGWELDDLVRNLLCAHHQTHTHENLFECRFQCDFGRIV